MLVKNSKKLAVSEMRFLKTKPQLRRALLSYLWFLRLMALAFSALIVITRKAGVFKNKYLDITT